MNHRLRNLMKIINLSIKLMKKWKLRINKLKKSINNSNKLLKKV